MSIKKKISLKDLLIDKSKIPVMEDKAVLKDALESMSKYKYGVCFCVNKKSGKLLGILTDGDVRRKILNVQKPFSALLNDDLILHINKKPSKVLMNSSLSTAVRLMKKKKIWDLPVVNNKNILIGMLHLHPVANLFLKKIKKYYIKPMKVIAFIPARLESKRLPNKVLRLIHNIPMIEHVRRRALLSGVFKDVVVVTNSKIIKNKLLKYNANVKLTKKKHLSGTSRVSEITKYYKFDYACILFADEPFINPNQLSMSIKKINQYKKTKVFNLITNLKQNDIHSKEVVKTVTDKNQNIINYFRKFHKNFKKKKN